MNTITLSPQDYIQVADDTLKTTSIKVAEAFGRLHKNVISKIESLECSKEFSQLNFKPAEYTDEQGKKRPAYEMTKDGFMFLVMGFTGKKAAQVKEAYINAFNWMAQQIRQATTLPAQKLTADQCRALQEAVQARVDHLPPQLKGGAYPKLWGAVKSHYRVPSYRELPQEKFDDALSLIGRLPLEGEHLPAMTNPEIPDPLYLNLSRDTANPKYGPYNGMLSADALCYGFGALSNPADELFRTLRQAVKTGRPIIVKDIEGAFIVYHMTRRYCWQYRALLHDFKKIADAYLNRGPHYTDNIVDRPPTDPA